MRRTAIPTFCGQQLATGSARARPNLAIFVDLFQNLEAHKLAVASLVRRGNAHLHIRLESHVAVKQLGRILIIPRGSNNQVEQGRVAKLPGSCIKQQAYIWGGLPRLIFSRENCALATLPQFERRELSWRRGRDAGAPGVHLWQFRLWITQLVRDLRSASPAVVGGQPRGRLDGREMDR